MPQNTGRAEQTQSKRFAPSDYGTGISPLLRLVCVLFAFAHYHVSMNSNRVVNCMFVLRSEAEYSVATQRVILRCVLEVPATGQRQGYTEVEALLTALRTELLTIQAQMIPPNQATGKT